MNEIEFELKVPLKSKQALQDGSVDSKVTENLKKAITSLDRGMKKADDTTKHMNTCSPSADSARATVVTCMKAVTTWKRLYEDYIAYRQNEGPMKDIEEMLSSDAKSLTDLYETIVIAKTYRKWEDEE